MKNLLLFLSLCLFPLMERLQAQELNPTPAAPTDQLAPTTPPQRVMPVKKVVLLYEVDEVQFAESQMDAPTANAADDHSMTQPSLDDQNFELKALLHLFSLAQVKAIRIKVSKESGSPSNELRFVVDTSLKKEATKGYARDGKTIVLDLGTIKGLQQHQIEVLVEGPDGRLSEPRYSSSEF